MLDTKLFADVARQMMTASKVQLGGKTLPVRRSSSQRLRMVAFEMQGREYEAIEQNPEKPSRWGKLAHEGHQVVQLLDKSDGRFVAVAIDGKVKQYGAMRKKSKHS